MVWRVPLRIKKAPKDEIVCRCANIPYGFVPCGWFGQDLQSGQIDSELAAWKAKYPNNISIVRVYSSGSRLYISACNGQTVPNLTDRFIVQAGHSYALGDTGGETKHKLTIAEMPSHKHNFISYNDDYNSSGNGGSGDNGNNSPWLYGLSHDSCTSTNYTQDKKVHENLIESNGGDTSHENRPPYYALYKLIKVI